MTTTLAEIAAISLAGIARSKPLRVDPDTTVLAVAEQLHQHHDSAVLVVRDGALVGIFTERDLMSRVDHTDPAWQTRPVSEVMTRTPATIRLDQTLEEALNLMLVGVYRHVPTLDASGEIDGIVSILDLLVHITEYFPEEFSNLPGDPEHEARGRWGG